MIVRSLKLDDKIIDAIDAIRLHTGERSFSLVLRALAKIGVERTLKRELSAGWLRAKDTDFRISAPQTSPEVSPE
jgi:hypothetical protein